MLLYYLLEPKSHTSVGRRRSSVRLAHELRRMENGIDYGCNFQIGLPTYLWEWRIKSLKYMIGEGFTTIGWIASIVLGSSNLASLICGNRQPLGEGASSPSSRCREQWCCQVSRERRRGAQAALLAG
ncbi:hypothetical protein ACFX2G_033040 [Malus domestica]